jgi:protein-S-isoprenylcysteine O-methyltransferase Ste14
MPNLLGGGTVVALMIVALFGSAGRWDLPFFWAYVAVNVAIGTTGAFVVDAELQQERWRPAARNREFWVMLAGGFVTVVGHWIVAGLDVGRFHWSARVPRVCQVASLIVHAMGWGLVFASLLVNRFFSPVVRIQAERRHHVITTGPYQFVRHPGYAGAIVAFVASPVALGSWWALVPIVPLIGLTAVRLIQEDRFLQRELPGYAGYATEVRYRLIPGVW